MHILYAEIKVKVVPPIIPDVKFMQSFLNSGIKQPTDRTLWDALLSKSNLLLADDRKLGDELEAITALLALIDPPPSNRLRSLDLKAGDLSTYYFAAFSSGLSMEDSVSVYRIVKYLVRYILFADRYYETGNSDYAVYSRQMLANAKKEAGNYLGYSLPCAIRQFTPFWQFEQIIRRRMLRGTVFSKAEIAHHNLFKSSDARHIYAAVLEGKLPNYDNNVTTILHYNQALQDIYDDLDDIAEDLSDRMPNVFILAASSFLPFAELRKLDTDQAEERILDSNASDIVMQVAEGYKRNIDAIAVPREYRFLKVLSAYYFQKISQATGKGDCVNPRGLARNP